MKRSSLFCSVKQTLRKCAAKRIAGIIMPLILKYEGFFIVSTEKRMACPHSLVTLIIELLEGETLINPRLLKESDQVETGRINPVILLIIVACLLFTHTSAAPNVSIKVVIKRVKVCLKSVPW